MGTFGRPALPGVQRSRLQQVRCDEGTEQIFDGTVGLCHRSRVSDLQRPGLLEMRQVTRSVPLPWGGVDQGRPALPLVQEASAGGQAAVVHSMQRVPDPVGLFQETVGKGGFGERPLQEVLGKLTPPTRKLAQYYLASIWETIH